MAPTADDSETNAEVIILDHKDEALIPAALCCIVGYVPWRTVQGTLNLIDHCQVFATSVRSLLQFASLYTGAGKIASARNGASEAGYPVGVAHDTYLKYIH